MYKEIIDKVMFDNFLKSVPTMVVDAKDRKTISAYGSIDINDLRSAIDTFKKVPEYGELLKQVKKQKEVIDRILNETKETRDILNNNRDDNMLSKSCLLSYLEIVEDILKEVSE